MQAQTEFTPYVAPLLPLLQLCIAYRPAYTRTEAYAAMASGAAWYALFAQAAV
jgi:hypothetical protein